MLRSAMPELAPALDGHADQPRILHHPELGDADPGKGRAKLVEQQPRNAIGNRLDQIEMTFAEQRADACHTLS